jgi:hypothetical protein
MSISRERAEKFVNKEQVRRTETDKRDAAFFRERQARYDANQEKTKRLRALRLAHEAELARNPPPVPVKAAAKRKPKAAAKAPG